MINIGIIIIKLIYHDVIHNINDGDDSYIDDEDADDDNVHEMMMRMLMIK